MSMVQQYQLGLTIVLLLAVSITSNNIDQFNYGETKTDSRGRKDFGVKDWDRISCDDHERCVSLFYNS